MNLNSIKSKEKGQIVVWCWLKQEDLYNTAICRTKYVCLGYKGSVAKKSTFRGMKRNETEKKNASPRVVHIIPE